MSVRIKNIYARLKKINIDGFIVSSQPNISYLTGYTSRDSHLLVSKKRNIYFTDSRYIEEARTGLKDIAVVEKINGSVFKMIFDACHNLNLKNIAFEEKSLTHSAYRKLKGEMGREIKLVPTHGLVEEPRQIKAAEELKKIKKATQITIKALKFIKNIILPGKKEIEIAAELEHFIRYNGGGGSAFDIIVASGPNSSFPHHITSQRRIKNNELVLVDLGVEYQGYKSDLTRVFFLGKINLLIRRIYDIVRSAKDKAIKEIRPGVPIRKIDASARQYITKMGYGSFFSHSLGHGIGLEVHEAPSISAKEKSQLKAGMVFTVEPAIYLPNKFGIRLEDMVLVTEEGGKIISGAFNK
jgi:Xaa-Pro aminopeptidase